MKIPILLLPSNDPKVKAHHLSTALRIAEAAFGSSTDPLQMDVSERNVQWTLQTIPFCWTLIVVGDECVGSAAVLPTSEESKLQFLSGTITEAVLMERAQAPDYNLLSTTSLYLSAVTVLPSWQRQGIGVKALLHTIGAAQTNLPQLQDLFCWLYSQPGAALIEKIQLHEGLKIQTLAK